MRRAFYLPISIAACLTVGLVAYASDWVDDNNVQTMQVPRPAPARRVPNQPIVDPQSYSEVPQAAPSRRSPGPANASTAPKGNGNPAFYVRPTQGGDKQPLQANVSKWEQGGDNRPDYLQGQANSLQVPLQVLRPTAVATPPQVFRGWLEKTHPSFALSTNASSSRNVVEVKGAWDDSSRTLRALGIHHQSVRGGALRDMSLDGVKVIVINCPGKVPQEAVQKIRDFVAAGGYLLTTDWALENVLQRAFPGYVAYNGEKASQTMVDATVTDLDPVLFKGAVTRAYWKVDDGSQLLRVLKPGTVRVLVTSRQLAADDPDRRGILSVNFAFGRGQVLHLVGHFDNNAGFGFFNTLPDPAPGIGISLRQALATNFIVEGLSR